MAESSWPAPSSGRVVDDNQYEKLALGMGPAGAVVGDFTSPQLVYGDSTGMQVRIAADRYAHVRGHSWWSGSSIVSKAISSNSSGSTRTDLVVLRLSRTTWEVTCEVRTGTPGAGPPSPTQNTGTTGVWELPLATVSVANGAATITAGNVTYVATHVTASGQLRVPSTTGLPYVPAPATGMEVTVADANGSVYRYDGSGWVLKAFLSGQGQRTLYTPTLTSNITNPTLGSGSVRQGWYTYLPGPSICYFFQVKFGTSGANAGNGSYAISLPVAAGTPFGGNIAAVGVGQLADVSSGGFRTAACWVGDGASTIGMVVDGPVNQGSPWTWANSDYIAGQVIYPV